MAFTIEQLRYFVVVAEERNISRAAERLAMQQPPLSQQIKNLEKQLQVQLFRRRARGVDLTEAGAAFFVEARNILGRMEFAIERTRKVARGEEGRLCIGVAPTAPFHALVPQVIRAYREAFPDVVISIEEVLSNQALDKIRAEQMDVAFLRADVANLEGLTSHRILAEPLIIAFPAQRFISGLETDRVDLADFAGEKFIVFGGRDGPGITDATIVACARAGFKPIIGQEAPRITSTLGLIASGMGVALVPESIARVKMDGVSYRSLTSNIDVSSVLNLVHRRDDSSTPLKLFARTVREAGKSFAK